MTILKSHRVNLDNTPWVGPTGERYATREQIKGRSHYDPRPEFEPTRDPYPWVVSTLNAGGLPDFRVVSLEAAREAMSYFEKFDFLVEWAPRREQFDTPVNRILADVRYERSGEPDLGLYYARWEQSIGDPAARRYWKSHEIEHARRVLTRLAGWSA